MVKSTVCFFSNLQPVEGDIQFDFKFLSKIKAPLALESLYNQGFTLTAEQRREYGRCCVQCVYADKGEYSWGTVINEDNSQHVICRCFKKNCPEFNDCCPNGLYEPEIKPSNIQSALLKYVDENLKNIGVIEKRSQIPHSLKVVIDEENGLEIVLEDESSDDITELSNEKAINANYNNTDNFIPNHQGEELVNIHNQYEVSEPEPEKKPFKPAPSYPSPSSWSDYWLTR